MFKRLRIALLLFILLFVAAGQYLNTRRSTDWDTTLWIDIYPLSGDGKNTTQNYLSSLGPAEFGEIEAFFTREAKRYDVRLDRPMRLNVAAPLAGELPQLAAAPSLLGTMVWSLRMRWLAMSVQRRSALPAGDVVVFAVFHDAADTVVLDRSTALQKGLIAVANLFANRDARGSNQVVLAHELLHTLGATDKYATGSNAPRFPEGFAQPNKIPLFPQSAAELMAGRIALDAHHAEIPQSLRQVVIGSATAQEIGWADEK